MSDKDSKTWTLRALTDIWTGDADGKPDRLITTGLLGSIRWWFEVLVRGLGGRACDPTSPVRCPDSGIKDPTKPGHHCVVCELFGCSGWARKFRFEVLDKSGLSRISQIKKDDIFQLRFTELRPIQPEEWALLDLTLRLIADYGAIGGKTTAKNTDYGLIRLEQDDLVQAQSRRAQLEHYVHSSHWRRLKDHGFVWASLSNLWFVAGRFLNAGQFDAVLTIDEWVKGRRGVSKKVLSFKEPEEGRRTFGFVKPGTVEFDAIKKRLQEKAWSGLEAEFRRGEQILEELLRAAGVES
jgi:CRISPR-associated protein Cmr1